MTGKIERSPKREWLGIHHSWSYRAEAFRWRGDQIAGVNFLPLATELRAWMRQLGPLSLAPAAELRAAGGLTNPYAVGGVTLQLILGRNINVCHEYATAATTSDNGVDAEVERIRLYGQLIVSATRFCEAAIKQLLYCTQIPKARYGRMALGQLLESWCPACKRENGNKPHLVSLVATLAHPFQLCMAFEQCAMDHMDLVNRLRNAEAAHAGVPRLDIRTVEDSKLQLLQDSNEALTGFVHMLSHLEDLERGMAADLVEKAQAINVLKGKGLAPADCNFNVIPKEPFTFERMPPA